MTKISIDRSSAKILALLSADNHQAFVVGGYVRNQLMGLTVTDVDIATDRTPNEVIEIAKEAKLKSVPTGIDHGTVSLVLDGSVFEVTTFRKDVETDGRHARIEFSSSVLEDAKRRDFTINALYADQFGNLLDPTQEGLKDISARQVRFIDDPSTRIKEDALRILRFFRFFAHYADQELGLDQEGLAACAQHADKLDKVSRERIGHEMRKTMSAPQPERAIAAMAQSGVLSHILPGADHQFLGPFVALEAQANLAPNWIGRLSILGGQSVQENLRLSKDEARKLKRIRDAFGMAIYEVAYRFGAKTAQNVMLSQAAVSNQPLGSNWQDEIELGANAEFPIQASDLKETGVQLGQKLRELENRWLVSRCSLSKKELLR